MGLESAGFDAADLDRFWAELVDRDRRELVARLQRASDRLPEIAARMPAESAGGVAGGGSGRHDWTPHQVLAHIVVLSKFYGALAHRIGSGRIEQADLLGPIRMRDEAGEAMAARSDAELVELALAEHRRTIGYLGSADATSLMRVASLAGRRTTAQDVARIALCAHLEAHLEQLEAACS